MSNNETKKPRWRHVHTSCVLAIVLITALTAAGCGSESENSTASTSASAAPEPGPIRATPSDDLQAFLDRAARATVDRRLIIPSGTYHSPEDRFCLIGLTRVHDGVVIEGEGTVVLSGRSAINEDRAAVSHIVYCGDGLGDKTVFRNLTLRGAKGRVSEAGVPAEDYGSRSARLRRGLFFQLDGAAVKIFGDSSPVFDSVDFVDNESDLCGGAVSVEHQGVSNRPAVFRNCRFINNRCPATGSAVDVLEGGRAVIENCLFVDNVGNYGMDRIRQTFGLEYNPEHGCGALTVFPGSQTTVTRCTFHQNWNAVDDHSGLGTYRDCLFSSNDATDGTRPGAPYELDVSPGTTVSGCLFNATQPDLQNTVSWSENTRDAGDPQFDAQYIPQNPAYASVGFRPALVPSESDDE